MKNVYLGIGSNIGDRENYLNEAVKLLNENEAITMINKSSIYETKPVGYEEQDNFLNAVLHVRTTLEPNDLLKAVGQVEQYLDRKRIIRWGPRTIDVDILLYDTLNINEDKLTIPHKEIWNRAFVLVPLLEIYPEDGPYYNKAISSLEKTEDKDSVIRYSLDD